MKNDDYKYHSRKRNRLKDWDYSTPHWYYVTICTQNHHEWFGEIVDGKMVLKKYGDIVKFTWYDLPNHNPNVELEEFVIMPNHFHGIIILKDIQNIVGTGSKSVQIYDSTTKRTGLDPVPTKKYHGLPEIVRQFKSFSTRRINKIHNTIGQKLWQRSYYDHIIRNEKELDNIRTYIQHNPLKWAIDKNNPMNL